MATTKKMRDRAQREKEKYFSIYLRADWPEVLKNHASKNPPRQP